MADPAIGNALIRFLSRPNIELSDASRGQVIAALKYSLDTSGDRSESLRAALGSLMEQVRTIAQRFRPPMIDDMGLAATLDWHLKQFSQQTGVRVRFRRVGISRRYHPDLEITLYRIVQEALTNVVKHANARRVRISVVASASTVSIEVGDDGVGFASDVARAGFGLAGMRERAFLAGGTVTIESAVSGTVVRAELPVRSHGAGPAA